MAKLQFNETTYEFKLQQTKNTNDSDIVLKEGVVLINGVAQYHLEYSYSPNLELYGDRALYEVFDVDDSNRMYSQYGEQGFPFYMVQSMVSHIMSKNNSK